MPIVTVNVSEQVAPLPETLQRTGAIVSVGATTLTAGTSKFLTQVSDLTQYIRPAATISSLAWLANVVTVTTASPHGLTDAALVDLTIAGATPSGYNGTFTCTVTGTDTFTYALANDPGAETAPGTWQSGYVPRLTAAVTTWFAQGNLVGVYVLELGFNSTATSYTGEIAALSAYLVANPNTAYTPGASGFYYGYLVPPQWDALTDYITLVTAYQGDSKRTYFFTTTTLSTYASYTNLQKAVFAEIETPMFSAYPSVAFSTATATVSGSVTQVSGTTAANHGVAVGSYFQVTGFTPTGYNGWWKALTGTTGATLVWEVPGSPGPITVEGTLNANQATSTGITATEFPCAASMYDVISNNPSSSNKVPPLAYTFQYGVTPWPTLGMSALLATLLEANINYVGTGSEGGISTATIFNGTLMNGDDFLVWYSVDAAQIYADVNLSNAVINGSNNKVNPLYYSQDGINRLQDVVLSTMRSLTSWGLANGTKVTGSTLSAKDFVNALDAGTYAGQIVVNAEPFIAYLTENPSDYRLERYAGLTCQYIASHGFRSIVFNLLVTSFVTQ